MSTSSVVPPPFKHSSPLAAKASSTMSGTRQRRLQHDSESYVSSPVAEFMEISSPCTRRLKDLERTDPNRTFLQTLGTSGEQAGQDKNRPVGSETHLSA